MTATGQPIWIQCEGSQGPGHAFNDDNLLMCRMCGHWLPATENGTVPDHNRDDVIARIRRGDFK